jgi:hypothetical protein
MEPKTIYIKYLVEGNEDKPLDVYPNEKISDVKKKIEKMLNITITNKLMIKHKQKRNQTSLENENLTVKEAHIKNGDTITIGKTEVIGG